MMRAAKVAVFTILAAAMALLPYRLCLSAALLHLPCPGCGMTRATLALLHGDWAAALMLHPLSIIIAPLGAAFALEQAARYIATGRVLVRLAQWQQTLLAALGALLVVVWVLRFFGWFGGPVAI
jgi:hypothetical protein